MPTDPETSLAPTAAVQCLASGASSKCRRLLPWW